MVILTFLIFRGVGAAPPGASPCAAAGCAGGVHGVWGPRVAGLVGAGGVRRCVASRASSRSTARSEEKCAREALATESGTPYVRNNFRAKMSEIRSMAPKWIWCASKLSRALDAKATSRSRAGGCWPAVERTPMPHSTRRLFRCQGPKLPFSTVAVHELGQLHEAYKHLRSSRHGSCGRLKTLCGLLGSAVRYRGGLYVIGTAVPLPSATGSDPHGMGPSHHNVARQAHKMAHTRPWWPRSSIAARARRISAHLECTPCSQQHATSNWLGSDNVWGSHTLRAADRKLES